MPLTEQQRIQIKTLTAEGKTKMEICGIVKCGHHSVDRWRSRDTVSNKENIAPGRGRKRLLSPSQEAKLVSIAKE